MHEREKEIQALKDELDRKREEIDDLKKLVGREIDRTFEAPVEEFSDKELDVFLKNEISALNDLADVRPDLRAILSPRKRIGRPITLLKRKLLETTFIQLDVFLDKQIGFNKQVLPLLRILHRRLTERLKVLEDLAAVLEEDNALFRDRLNEIASRLK